MDRNLLKNKGLECVNCGRPLQGEEHFCPECGQQNDIRKVSIKEMILHFFGGFFAFDNLFFRTLKPLILKPGLVSKEYIEGKRKKYTNPFIFLLHSAILYFIINSLVSFIKTEKKDELYKEQMKYLIQQNIDSVLSIPQNILMLKDSGVAKIEKEQFFKQIFETNNKIYTNFKTKIKDKTQTFEIDNYEMLYNYSSISKYLKKNNLTFDIDISGKDSISIIPKEQFNSNKKKSKLNKFLTFSEIYPELPTFIALDSLNEKPTQWNIFLYEKVKNVNQLSNNLSEDSSEIFNQFTSMIPMALFVVLPLFTLLFSLLYYRHPHTYTEHLIVVFNIQSVLFWMMLLSAIIGIPFEENISDTLRNFFLLFYLYYVYRTLRKFYGQNRFKTILKFIFISLSYFVFAGFGALILLLIVMLK